MSLQYYNEKEESEKEESIDNYENLFSNYISNLPTLEEALNQIFISGGVPENELKNYIEDIFKKINDTYKKREKQIKETYPLITFKEAQIITSYTCEAKNKKYSPYKILNKNLVSDNRKEGLEKISKYFYILLITLRKLPRYYPEKYLYRCIDKKVNIFIDPYSTKKITPYIRGNEKTFWAFTSTSPNVKKSFKFLADNENFEEKEFKYGTIFSLYGKIWGYDITMFNYYDEEEIILEPERKYKVDNVIPDLNDIINVTCEIKDTFIVLNEDYNKNFLTNNNTPIISMNLGKKEEPPPPQPPPQIIPVNIPKPVLKVNNNKFKELKENNKSAYRYGFLKYNKNYYKANENKIKLYNKEKYENKFKFYNKEKNENI